MTKRLGYFSRTRLPAPPPTAGGADSFVAFRSVRIILSRAELASCSASTCDCIARMTLILIGAPEAERVGVAGGGLDRENVTGLGTAIGFLGFGTMPLWLLSRGRSFP